MISAGVASRRASSRRAAAGIVVAALCLLASGCATTSDATAQVERVARLTVDPTTGIPFVLASVDGQEARLIVDSGSSYHLLDTEFARRLNLYLVPATGAVDVAGRSFEFWISASTKVQLGAWRVVHDGVGVADMPAGVRRSGLMGLLSPQWLDTGHGTIVLDLPALELRWMTDDTARQRFAGRTTTPIERCEGLYSVRLGVRALVDGVRALLEVDTGRTISTFDPARPLGKRLAAYVDGSQVESVGLGGLLRGRQLKPMAIGVGEARMTVRPALVERPKLVAADVCEYEGALGNDVLRQCVLVFAHDRASLSCTPPPAPSP